MPVFGWVSVLVAVDAMTCRRPAAPLRWRGGPFHQCRSKTMTSAR